MSTKPMDLGSSLGSPMGASLGSLPGGEAGPVGPDGFRHRWRIFALVFVGSALVSAIAFAPRTTIVDPTPGPATERHVPSLPSTAASNTDPAAGRIEEDPNGMMRVQAPPMVVNVVVAGKRTKGATGDGPSAEGDRAERAAVKGPAAVTPSGELGADPASSETVPSAPSAR